MTETATNIKIGFFTYGLLLKEFNASKIVASLEGKN